MTEPGRVSSVTVRADDLTECIEEACAHLAYWAVADPDWLHRLRAALSESASTQPSGG